MLRTFSHRSHRSRLLAGALLTLAVASPLAAAETRRLEHTAAAAGLHTVEIENLAGRVTLVPAPGNRLSIVAEVRAEASAGRSAAALADSIRLDASPQGDRLVVKTLYPVDEHRRYHYPGGDAGSGSEPSWLESWLGGSSSGVRYQGQDVRVSSASASNAATLWADFRVEVPAGVAIRFKNVVGRIESKGLASDQNLDTASGEIDVRDSRGDLVADTGSGNIHVLVHDGNVSADTGSGDVTLERVTGQRLAADTGSGDIAMLDCRGDLVADTGSGDIRGRGMVFGDSLRADTGSGDVRLAGDFSAVQELIVDTGSGSVVLDVAGGLAVKLTVSTGSGDIEVDLPDMRVRKWKGDFVADVGAATGRAVVDTGSGDVRIVGR